MEKTLRRKYLAAVIAAVSGPAVAADGPPWVIESDRFEVPEGSWETRGDSENGLWVRKSGGARGTNIILDTFGRNSAAVAVDGNGEVTLTGGMLRTSGASSYGLQSTRATGASITLEDVAIATQGGTAHGISATGGDTDVAMLGGSITTVGYAAIGALGEENAYLKILGTRIATTNTAAHGIVVRGKDSTLELKDGSIETGGVEANGILVSESAKAVLRTPNLKTVNERATVLKTGEGASVTVLGGRFESQGAGAIGIYGGLRSDVTVDGTHIETQGTSSPGVDNRSGLIKLDNATLITLGRRSFGLLAQGGDVPGVAPDITATTSSIVTDGTEAHGAYALNGGTIRLTRSSIETHGSDAYGARIAQGRIVASGTSIKTVADNTHGVVIADGTLSATDSTIETTGDGAYGALVFPGGTLDLYGGSITTTGAAALGLDRPDSVRIGGGALVIGGNGIFAEVVPSSNKAVTIELDGEARAIGDVRSIDRLPAAAADAIKPALHLKNRSQWQGATDIIGALSLESGSTWTITGDSHIGSLASNRGVVAFAPTAPNTFATVTVAGNYEGNGGLLRMRSQLGDDSSPGDLLHVMGDTSGDTRIAVDALDGAGGQTQEGIQLVRVDGASHGDFDLAGRAVAGAYEYFLHKGSISAPDDGGWYLRSTREPDPIVEPETGTPEPEGGFVDIPEPETKPEPVVGERLLRPEVGTYRANQTAALEMFQGGPGAGEDEERTGARQHVWARFDRRHTAFNVGNQLTTTSSTSELTIGADLFHDPDTDAHVGIMASTGRADTRGTSNLTHYSARGRVRGSAGGIYGGLRADVGTYLRGWAQYGHFNQRVEGDALRPERYGTGVLTASLEGGHRWRHALTRDTDTYIEPQAEILMSRLRGGKHIEANGTHVAARNASGATARLGVRTAARWNTPNGHVASPYFAANWLRRLGRLDATTFNQEAFTAGVPRNSYALKLGVALLRSSGWSAWTDVETRFGAQRYRRVTGSIGIRKSW